MRQALPPADISPPPAPQPQERISIATATTKSEKEKIYRLRYQVYVEEMGKRLSNADHRRRMLIDDMDDWGLLLYARADGDIVGTLRLHIGEKSAFSPELAAVFAMDAFPTAWPDSAPSLQYSFISKGIVAPNYRSSKIFDLLTAAYYETCRQHRVAVNFVGCAPYLVPIYERHGARRYKSAFEVPDYGCMVPLVNLLADLDHLRRVRSPLRETAARWPSSPDATAWLTGAFPPAADKYINRHLIDQASLWQLLSDRLGQPPEKAVTIFKGLSHTEALICADAGHIYFADQGDTIVHPFDMSHEIFVVLSGTVAVHKQLANRRQTILVHPGQAFGEKAFATYSRQNITVTAQTDAELLIIPRHRLSRLQISHPAVAARLLTTIGGRTARKYA